MKRLLLLLFPVGIYSWLIFCIAYSNVTEEDQQPIIQAQTAEMASKKLLEPKFASWPADAATKNRIEKMRQLAEFFAAGNQPNALNAHQQLGKKLNHELKHLLKNNTKTKPEHRKQSAFLKPIVKDVKILRGNDLRASSEAALRLKERLSVYQISFE